MSNNYKSILQYNNTELSSNNLDLQALIDQANALPDAGGVDLPELTNEGTAADLLSGKELIDGDGNKVTGTFSIDSELNTQDDLIAQIQSVVDSLPEAGGGSSEPALQNKTVIPSTSSQIVTADSGYDGLDTVTVNAIPSTYIKPTFTKTATTYTPSTTNQTIAAGTYCSGVQTIKGDANLIPANIVSGKSIFGIAGTAEVGGSSTGGINDQTCTVTFDNESLSRDCPVLAVVATVLENGVRETYAYHYKYNGNGFDKYLFTIPNVVCGTKIYLTSSVYQVETNGVFTEIDGSAIYESWLLLNAYDNVLLTFTAPTVANENCTIYYAYDA